MTSCLPHLSCSCLDSWAFCSQYLHAIASAPSWNLFSAISLHMSWFLPYPAGLALLHVSYSHLQRENTCWVQQLISPTDNSSHTNPHLDHIGLPIVLVFIPIGHDWDVVWDVVARVSKNGDLVQGTMQTRVRMWYKHWEYLENNIPKPSSQFLTLFIPSMYPSWHEEIHILKTFFFF